MIMILSNTPPHTIKTKNEKLISTPNKPDAANDHDIVVVSNTSHTDPKRKKKNRKIDFDS